MKALAVEIAKLELKAGEVLAVMSPEMLSAQQCERMRDHLKGVLPDGVEVVILGGGITLAKISQEQVQFACGGEVAAGRPYLVGERMLTDAVGAHGCKATASGAKPYQ